MEPPSNHARPRLPLAAVVAVVLAGTGIVAGSPTRADAAPSATVAVPATPGSSTAIPGFLLQSSAKTGGTGAQISQPGYDTAGWYPVAARSTVLAGLLQNNKYPDPFYSTNMKNIPTADFTVPWWYRADLTVTDTSTRTYVDLSGVLSKADIFVNGTQVATSAQVVGAYTAHEFDLTALVRTGTNSIAIRVYPNDPNKDLSMGWIDWAQTPPDKNMGIVRDVRVHRGGAVALRGGHIVTALNPGLTRADLTVKAEVRNDSAAAVSATVAGSVAGTALTQTVALAAHETKTVTFGQVTVNNPGLWWPAGMGAQTLNDLTLTASVGGAVSDTYTERFGIRDVKAPLDGSGHRRYSVNGKPLLIRGGGWSPDLFLRWDAGYAADKLRYVLDLGLNTVRLEGHIEPDEFFAMTDEMGILTLPGWECCDKWEGQVNGSEPGDTWTAADYVTAKDSMSAEARRLRDHPSVISFLIGSDFAPTTTIEKNYVDALNAADWALPVVASAADRSAPITGASGMKMPGPYDWVPPGYWYNKREGGAFGFASETSAGPDVPTLDTLKRMMSSAELDTLWKNYNATQYHRSQSATFGTLKIFDNAITGRYGAPTSLDDYVRKAQLAQYENTRAQFESFGRNFTDATNPADGVIYWMLNSGWTSLHWQLFDYYLDQGGSYYGAKKAGEPLHVQYSYDNRQVVVVNSQPGAASGLTVKVDLFNPDGTNRFSQTATGLSVAGGGGKASALTVPASVTGLSTTYLARLLLTDASGHEVSRNVYWLSTKDDVIDWSKNDWYYVPTSSYADLKGLAGMAQAPVSATASSTVSGDTTTTSVTLRNTGTAKTPAFYLDAHLVGTGDKPVLPVRWSDNAVSLWPGEQTTLTATYRTADLHGAAPKVRVSGWNAATQTVPAGGGGDGQPPSTPGNLRATAVTGTSAALAWNASTDNVGVTGYDVLRDGSPIATVSGTSYTDPTLTAGTTYSYIVVARDAAGNSSPPTAPLSVTTPGTSTGRSEAENATLSQATVASNHLGYSGTGFVDYTNVTGGWVQWTVTGASNTLTLRYANGTTVNRPMTITVNGTVVATDVAFPGTGNWDTWASVTLNVPLPAGTSTVRATATTANGGPNVDYLETS
ncbi:carbohydrate-binding protein [Longispora sp. K20-0274]|uniref:glycosyl hydrolase 2 galactose-binding domain-containing protein n=1 Tax=Longispora sp. K20-0274 TaxID=3088255 RepID=UPI00399AA0F2